MKSTTLEISRLEWNDPSIKIIVPTQLTASIVANTAQMFKAVKDLTFKEDLISVFSKILQSFREIYVSLFKGFEISSKTGAQR